MHRSKLSGVLHKGFKPDKCKIALKMAMARIKLLRNKKEAQVRQMRREVAQLLEGNQDQTARIRVEHVIREEKFMQAYDLIEVYCELIVARMSIIDSQKTCPIDLKEAIASVIFASMRCSDVTELGDVRKNFTSKYGKEFATSALEVRPDSGVNRLVIEKLSAGAPDVQTKTKTLSSIAAEHNIKWEPKAFEENTQKQNEDLTYGSTYSGGNVPTSGSSASSIPTPQPAATSRMPTGHSYESSEVPANRNPHGAANSSSSTQENRRVSDASVPPRSQHGATTYSSEEIPRSNNFPHENTGNSSVSRPYSQYGSTVSDTIPRTEEINRPRERKSSASGSNWNVEFKDAASAAQAAAESAEMASIAARAAAQLASRGNFYEEQNTGDYESAAYMHDTTPRKQQAEHLMKNDKRSSNEQSSGPRRTSSNAREDEERAKTSHVSSQNISTTYSSFQHHSYAPESQSHTDMYGMPTEAPRAHSSEPPYFDDSSEKESSIGRHDDHLFDLHEERFPDAGFDGHRTKDMESRRASFNEENINNYDSNFSASHSGSSPTWDNRSEKAGADSSAVTFDQYDYDVEEENLLDRLSSKHTEEIPTVQDHKGFSSADWSRQPKSESPVGHNTSTLFSEIETQPSYDLGANKEDIPLSHSYDTTQPTFDSDGASSDEDISTGMHGESLRSHSRGSDYSENKMFSNISGKLVPDVNDNIEDDKSRSRKQYQNPPGYDVFDKEQQSDGSPRFDYSGAQGSLGSVQIRDYDLSEEETEPPKLKGTSSIKRANENRPLSFRLETSVLSDDNDEGDLGLNYGRLTPGLRNKPRQPPQYKNSGGNLTPKQSLQKAPSSIEESVYSKESDMSSKQTSDTPKSSRTTKNSVGADYISENYDRKHNSEKPVESRSSVTRNYFGSGDTGKLSERSGTTPSPNPITTSSPVSASSSQDLRHERPGIGVGREGRSRNSRTYFDPDGSEEELEPRQTGQTKFSKEPIQSRRTREVTSDTKRVGRVRTGAQYAAETESTPKERKTPAEASSNLSTEQNRVAPPYSRVSVQQSSPKPGRIEPPAARGKWQEDEPDGSSSEDEGNAEASAGTPKGSTPASTPAHIHPKLPTDYDSFAAHFKSLRTNRR
ncbi:hypothetical protein QYE76_054830 [Lolium multiflorum]|uniref:IST1-like protein n=1 Tax=Lolium multiflorum TaxID=4521 RepID=A0AAD8WLQ3_LOLMU|nr:hypothetical protein QYE76_054830 [Lolium multiflorum]